jgi:hypothetical protein
MNILTQLRCAQRLSPASGGFASRFMGQSGSGLVAVLPAIAALALWWMGAHGINLERTTDIGLVSALPWEVFVALALLTIGFTRCLTLRPLSVPMLAFYAVALGIVLYGTTAIAEPVTGTKIVWRHAGIVDEIANAGAVDPRIDAYFNWPGFFALFAFLAEAAGLRGVIGLARWAPLFFNLAFLVALYALFTRLTADRRHAWLATWVFLIANWVAQDYFAPQAMGYLLYLVILVLLFTFFAPIIGPDPAGHEPGTARPNLEAMAAMGAIILLFAATVASHQLTPWAVLSATSVLVLAGRCRARRLPLLMGVMILAWLVFMTTGFLSGHLEQLLGGVGDVSGAASANVGSRVGGSSGHLVVVGARGALTGAVWVLAGIGWWRRRRLGHDDRAVVLLALAPFPLLFLQAYGGEMLMRVYFFGLPFMAFLAAGAILSRRAPGTGAPQHQWVLPAFVCLALTTGFLFARYGNERFDYFTDTDLAAVQRLYEVAEPGSVVIAASNNLPWQGQDYADYRYRLVTNFGEEGADAEAVAQTVMATMLARHETGAYFILTRSQRVYQEAMGGLPDGSLERIDALLRSSSAISLVYQSDDAAIFANVTANAAPRKGGS